MLTPLDNARNDAEFIPEDAVSARLPKPRTDVRNDLTDILTYIIYARKAAVNPVCLRCPAPSSQ